MFGKSLDTARSQAYSVARYFFEILGVEENDELSLLSVKLVYPYKKPVFHRPKSEISFIQCFKKSYSYHATRGYSVQVCKIPPGQIIKPIFCTIEQKGAWRVAFL